MEIQNENVDIAFVIDTTGDMAQYSENIKKTVYRIIDEIKEMRSRWNRRWNALLRAKLITFTDFATEGEDAIRQTNFFNLPEEREKFDEAFSEISYEGGGDDPENALEAIYRAMQSDWRSLKFYDENGKYKFNRGVHIIFVISSAYPLKLYERDGCPGYPEDEFPQNVGDLGAIWEETEQEPAGSEKATKLDDHRKGLFLIVPEGEDDCWRSWDNLRGWDRVLDFNFDEWVADTDELITHILTKYSYIEARY